MKEKIQELERQIAALPIGYISKKTINGKTRYYHQWTENGKKQPISAGWRIAAAGAEQRKDCRHS